MERTCVSAVEKSGRTLLCRMPQSDLPKNNRRFYWRNEKENFKCLRI